VVVLNLMRKPHLVREPLEKVNLPDQLSQRLRPTGTELFSQVKIEIARMVKTTGGLGAADFAADEKLCDSLFATQSVQFSEASKAKRTARVICAVSRLGGHRLGTFG